MWELERSLWVIASQHRLAARRFTKGKLNKIKTMLVIVHGARILHSTFYEKHNNSKQFKLLHFYSFSFCVPSQGTFACS